MAGNRGVERDERTVYVENASYRVGYLFFSFALLLDVMYRSFMYNEAPWDLLGIVIVGGFLATMYQMRCRALPSRWAQTTAVVALLSVLVAILAVFMLGL